MTERERELYRSSYAAQLDSLGYGSDGTPKEKKLEWPEWISVKDRLPDKKHKSTLICTRMGRIGVAYFQSGHWLEFFGGQRKRLNNVEYWMPLPNLPGKEINQ